MTEALEATKHLYQKLTSLDGAATDRLANLGKHLNLKTIRSPNHSDKARNLHDTAPAPLCQSHPRRFAILRGPQALTLKPSIDRLWDCMHPLDARNKTRCLGDQRLVFVDRNTAHLCPSDQVDKVW